MLKIKLTMVSLSRSSRKRLQKAFSVITSVSTVLWVSGVLLLVPGPGALAVTPADYGLKEGDTISAAGSDDPDVYIVNEHGFKRLFLNPVIFNFYGHLGGFGAVKNVAPATRDAFGTSGLFRNCEANDEKVYGVEVSAEDSGTLHWVNTSGSQAVADDANFFKKVFCVNNNEFNWYPKGSDYTSVSQVPSYSRVPGQPPVATGPLSVSLAPDNPAAKTITLNATGVQFLKVRFSGSGTISTMTIKRLGAGETNDFANVYIYDGAKRLTSGKTFSSSTGETTFISLNVAVNGSKDLSIVADMDATNNTAGNVNMIQLKEVAASGTLSGLPVNGNNMTSSGASSGSVTIAKSGSLANPTVGQKDAILSEFKITANTEAASLKRLTMINGGTIKASDVLNPRLTAISGGSGTWSGTSTSDGYLVFDLGAGFSITKGGNAIFRVISDVNGKKDETVDLYFENDADTFAVGDQYGQGMAVSDDALDTAAEATTLTLQGGVLTIAFNGPSASNIATNSTDAVLLKFKMTAAANIEIRKSEFTICHNNEGTGDFDSITVANGTADMLDFKVTNEDTNAVVIGPKDGSVFDTADSGTCPNAADGAQEAFSDVVDLSAGKTYNFKVTADFDADATDDTGYDFDADDIVKAVLDDYTDDTPDLTVMKYAGTNTSVADADIVPGSDVAGPNMTLTSSSLTIGLAATPGSQTFIKGTKNVNTVGITFRASLSSALKVTDIVLTGYVDDDNAAPFAKVGSGVDASLTTSKLVGAVRLYEAETNTLISSAPAANNLNSSTGTVTFNNLAWNIAGGATRTLLVQVDLSTNDASGTAGDFVAFDIDATTDVTAVDSSNNTVNAGNADVNGGTTPTKILTVKNSGTMTLATAPDSPLKGAVYWGQTSASISKFRITATDEGQYIEKLTIAASVADEATAAKANVKEVILTYKNKTGDTLTTTQSFTNGASANFGWSFGGSGTDTRPFVPKDSSLDIAVAANMRTKAEGATQMGLTTTTFFSLDLVDKFDGSDANGFRALGDGSGAVTDGSGTNISDVVGANNQYIYRVFPKFDIVSLPAPYTFIGTPTVFKFTVTAMGLSDSKLFFDNQAVGSGSLKFEVVSSGQWVQANASTQFTVYEDTGGTSVLLDTNTLTQDARTSTDASLTFDFTTQDIEITGGLSKTFRIQIDNPNTNYAKTSESGRAADYFQVVLRDNEASLIQWVGNHAGTTAAEDTASTTGVLRNLPLFGPVYQR